MLCRIYVFKTDLSEINSNQSMIRKVLLDLAPFVLLPVAVGSLKDARMFNLNVSRIDNL